MKIPKIISHCLSLIIAFALLPAGGCAHTQRSALPITVLPSPGSEILDVRSFERGQKLFVSGSLRKHRGLALSPSAQVRIQLLGANGEVLAESSDDIDARHPKLPHARTGTQSFVAAFPVEIARDAAKVRVTFLSGRP